MNVFMVFGNMGNGGGTFASMSRANMFSRSGERAAMIFLEWIPHIDKRLSGFREAGGLDANVEVLNPFKTLQSEIDERGIRTRNYLAAYFQRKWNAFKYRRAGSYSTEISRRSDASPYRVRRFIDGVLIVEEFYAKSGQLYVKLEYVRERVGRVQVYWPSEARFVDFSTKSEWHIAWMNELARQASGDSVFICDGPGSMRTVSKIDPKLAIRIGQMHTNHFADPPYAVGSRLKPIYAAILEFVSDLDAFVVLTEAQARDLRTDFGSLTNIQVIPNIITATAPEYAEKTEYRASLFARLVGSKAVGDAIQAFHYVVQQLPDAKLDIYGDGSQRRRLQLLIEELGLSDTVAILGHTTVPVQEMASSVCTVLPSRYEGFSFAIAESMLAGTPPVAYDCNYGPRDLIDNHADGILVSVGDVRGLAEGIVGLLRDPGNAAKMGEAGRSKIASRYTGDAVLRRWNLVIDDLKRSRATAS